MLGFVLLHRLQGVLADPEIAVGDGQRVVAGAGVAPDQEPVLALDHGGGVAAPIGVGGQRGVQQGAECLLLGRAQGSHVGAVFAHPVQASGIGELVCDDEIGHGLGRLPAAREAGPAVARLALPMTFAAEPFRVAKRSRRDRRGTLGLRRSFRGSDVAIYLVCLIAR